MPNDVLFVPELDDLLTEPASIGQVPIANGDGSFTPTSLGSSVDASYTHTQTPALSEWTVMHNLGKFVVFRVKDTTGREVHPEIISETENELVLDLRNPTSGKVFCS